MNSLTPQVLAARHLVGDRVILDWLELVLLSQPLDFGCRGRGVHISTVINAWACSQPMASRRIAAINTTSPEAGLGRIERAWGRHGWWRLLFHIP